MGDAREGEEHLQSSRGPNDSADPLNLAQFTFKILMCTYTV